MSDLYEWEAKLPDEFLTCRDTTFSHDWQLVTTKRGPGGFVRTIHCPRCETTKKQYLDPVGYIIITKTVYNPDYLRPKGAGRVTKDDNARMRLASMKPRRKR